MWPLMPRMRETRSSLETAHDAGHDDQRGDAERDADQGEDRDDRDEALAFAGAQIAAGDGAFEGTEHALLALPRAGAFAAIPASPSEHSRASSGDTSVRSPVARRFSSTLPAAAPRGPTMICHGCPIRSASANLAPARSSRSSYSAARAKLRVQRLAHRVARRIAAPQVEDRRLERRDAVRPDDACIVVAGLDHRADQARYADAVAAHLRDAPSRRPAPATVRVHRLGVLGAEIEDVADLDAAAFTPARGLDLAPTSPRSCFSSVAA